MLDTGSFPAKELNTRLATKFWIRTHNVDN